MGAEVVHHDDIAVSQSRTEHAVEIGEEDVGVRGSLDGHGGDHAAETHRAQDGQHLPVALGRAFVQPLATEAASEASRHADRDATFVNKDKPFRRNRQDRLVELGAPLAVGFGVALEGVERLFFSRRPSRTTQFRVTVQLIATPLSVTIRSRNSAMVMSGSS